MPEKLKKFKVAIVFDGTLIEEVEAANEEEAKKLGYEYCCETLVTKLSPADITAKRI